MRVGSAKLYSSIQLCIQKCSPSVQVVYRSTVYLSMNLHIKCNVHLYELCTQKYSLSVQFVYSSTVYLFKVLCPCVSCFYEFSQDVVFSKLSLNMDVGLSGVQKGNLEFFDIKLLEKLRCLLNYVVWLEIPGRHAKKQIMSPNIIVEFRIF